MPEEPAQELENIAVDALPTVNAPPADLTPEPIKVYPQENKSSSPIKIIIFLIFFLLIASASLFYFLKWLPDSQARRYLNETSKDFANIQESLKDSYKVFSDLPTSFSLLKETYEETDSKRSYIVVKADTEKDVKDINKTLETIVEANKTRKELKVPKKLGSLDVRYESYNEAVENGMVQLLAFKQFQLRFLESSGDEFNGELNKLITEYSQPHSNEEIRAYLVNLSRLAGESVKKMDGIKEIPPGEEVTALLLIGYHLDVLQTSANISAEIETTSYQELLGKYLPDYFQRNRERNTIIQEEANKFILNSPIKGSFESASSLQPELLNLFKNLNGKYGISVKISEQHLPESSTPVEATQGAN